MDVAEFRLYPHRGDQVQYDRRYQDHRPRSHPGEPRHPDQPGSHQVRAARSQNAEGRGVGSAGVARRGRGEGALGRTGEISMTVDVRKDLPDNYKFGWEDKDAVYRTVKRKGLSAAVVHEISQGAHHA